MKDVKIILSEEAKEVFDYLNKESRSSKIEKSILNAVKQKFEFIKLNPHYGNPISKTLIPQKYIEEYGITNLFRVELPNFWRLIYTLSSGESVVEIICFVLDLFDHKDYNKKFGYRNK